MARQAAILQLLAATTWARFSRTVYTVPEWLPPGSLGGPPRWVEALKGLRSGVALDVDASAGLSSPSTAYFDRQRVAPAGGAVRGGRRAENDRMRAEVVRLAHVEGLGARVIARCLSLSRIAVLRILRRGLGQAGDR